MLKFSLEIVTLLIFTIFSLSYGDKYCDYQRKYCTYNLPIHIGCNNNGKAKCPGGRIIPLNAELKNLFINEHNKNRNKIASGNQPGYKQAARMATMTWDDELEYLAKLNSNLCDMKHMCTSTDRFPHSGQNLYYSWSTQPINAETSINEAINYWYGEHERANSRIIQKFVVNPDPKKPYGHFTAMVKENSNKVGCAILEVKKGGKYYHYLACNYASTNLLDRPIYTSGSPGSGCKTKTNSEYPALCNVKEVYDP